VNNAPSHHVITISKGKIGGHATCDTTNKSEAKVSTNLGNRLNVALLGNLRHPLLGIFGREKFSRPDVP
jgi:hypothetical protein